MIVNSHQIISNNEPGLVKSSVSHATLNSDSNSTIRNTASPSDLVVDQINFLIGNIGPQKVNTPNDPAAGALENFTASPYKKYELPAQSLVVSPVVGNGGAEMFTVREPMNTSG